MHFTSFRSGMLVTLVALALPLKATGCGGRTACFTVTSSDLDHGACPAMDVATARLVNTTCQGSVASVDGAGSLSAGLCCYPVTYTDNTTIFGGGCDQTSFPGDTSAISTGSGPVTGFGGSGTTGCVSCGAWLDMGAPAGQVCDPQILANLRVCACASNCTAVCDPTVCTAGNSPDNACLSCMQGACSAELTTCQQH